MIKSIVENLSKGYDNSYIITEIINSVYSKNIKEVTKRFNDGYATCTFMTKQLADELEKNKIDFQVVSGDFKNEGHWWIVVNYKYSEGKYYRWLLDLGDNISKKAIISGNIEKKILKITDKDYKPEKYFSYKEFLKYYPKISKY